MRLIDADELEKAIYEWMPKDQSTWMDSYLPPIENLVVSIMMTIQEQPAVNAELVVRCEDCKFVGTDATCCLVCNREGMGLRPFHVYHDDFCSYAVRKEE